MSGDDRLIDAVNHWKDLRRQGKELSAREICEQLGCPDLESELELELANLKFMDGWDNQLISLPTTILEWRKGNEVIPGYTLIDRLGRGGFGEVWEAIGPEGRRVALKRVLLDGPLGESEKKSLGVIRYISHANIVETFAIREFKDELVLEMELGTGTLRSRLTECAPIHGGIPFPELITYLKDAAKAIDHLNARLHESGGKMKRIVHGDIKPANLLLIDGIVKVADFGLARFTERSNSSHSGGYTPQFAAPELFTGKTSPHVDQYCLAITYCVLRSDRSPIPGETANELMVGHLTKSPDLSMLPLEERSVLSRALAKKPEDRWEGCCKFVAELVKQVEEAQRRREEESRRAEEERIRRDADERRQRRAAVVAKRVKTVSIICAWCLFIAGGPALGGYALYHDTESIPLGAVGAIAGLLLGWLFFFLFPPNELAFSDDPEMRWGVFSIAAVPVILCFLVTYKWTGSIAWAFGGGIVGPVVLVAAILLLVIAIWALVEAIKFFARRKPSADQRDSTDD